jgi:hypothetical protein
MLNKKSLNCRSNASLYGGGNKDDLYDRLRRHAYQGKKSGMSIKYFNFKNKGILYFLLLILSNNQSNNQMIIQLVNQTMNQMMNQTMNRMMNQTIN